LLALGVTTLILRLATVFLSQRQPCEVAVHRELVVLLQVTVVVVVGILTAGQAVLEAILVMGAVAVLLVPGMLEVAAAAAAVRTHKLLMRGGQALGAVLECMGRVLMERVELAAVVGRLRVAGREALAAQPALMQHQPQAARVVHLAVAVEVVRSHLRVVDTALSELFGAQTAAFQAQT